MATITVTTPRPASPFNPDDLSINLHDKEPWKRDIEGLLLKLGEKLIEHGLNSGWMSLSQVSAFCRRYRLHWQPFLSTQNGPGCTRSVFGANSSVW